MKQRKKLSGMPYLAILAGVAGYFFRLAQLGGGSIIPLAAFCVLMALLFLLAAVSVEKESAYDDVFHPMAGDLLLSALAAGAFGAYGVQTVLRGGVFFTVLGVLAVISAVGLLTAAIFRMRGKAPKPVFYVFVILLLVVQLFYDFRHWMIDPAIKDYCFMLFALIAFMLTSYHAAAFSFDKGSRRTLVFFALCGVMFGGVSLAGGSMNELLLYGGGVLWMLGCAMQAM